MRERKNQRNAGQVPFRLWAPGRLHTFLSFATASALVFVPSAAHADATPVVSVGAPADAAEGDALRFPVTLSEPSATPITILVSTNQGTATGGSDYTALASTPVTFDANETQKYVEVATADDGEEETTAETVSLEIVDDGDADPGTLTATGTIVDAMVSVVPVGDIVEGDAANRTQEIDINLNVAFQNPFSLKYAIGTGTAFAGYEFEGVAETTLTFAPGEKTKRISMTIHGDDTYKGADKTFKLVLSDFSGGVAAGAGERTLYIVEDETLPVITSVSGHTVPEGPSGPTVVTFTVRINNPSNGHVNLNVTGDDGSAVQTVDGNLGSNDYGVPSSVVIDPGQTTATFDVTVYGDDVYEGDETASIVVSPDGGNDPTSGGVPQQGTLTITDDDPKPVVTVNDFDTTEGVTGVGLGFQVTGDAQDPIPYTATVGGIFDPNMAVASDADTIRTGLNALTGTIQPGEDTISLGSLDVPTDTIDEEDEKLKIEVAAQGLATATAAGTIHDDGNELPPRLTMPGQLDVTEGMTARIPVTLDFTADSGNAARSTEKTITVDYTVHPPYGAPDEDIPSASLTGTLTFEPPATVQHIVVPTIMNQQMEGTEGFNVQLSNPANTDGSSASTSVQIVEDNPRVYVGLVADTAEGAGMKFAVRLSRPMPDPVTVKVSTTPLDGFGFATEGTDYTPLTDVTVTFQPNQQEVIVTVPTLPDYQWEQFPEIVELRVTDSDLAIAGIGERGKIVDPVLTVEPAEITEGANGGINQTLQVRLSPPLDEELQMDFRLEGNMGNVFSDVFPDPQSPTRLTFAPGETSKSIDLIVINDNEVEPDESFRVTFTNTTHQWAETQTGNITLHDDDAGGTPSITSVVGPGPTGEGGSSQNIPFTVNLDRPAPANIDLDVLGVDGTAVQAGVGLGSSDYTVQNTVTIPQGATTYTFFVTINGDEVYEDNETADIVVRPRPNDPNITGGEQRAPLTIGNDDAAPTLALNVPTPTEQDYGFPVWATVTGDAQKPYNWTAQLTGIADGGVDPAEPSDMGTAGMFHSGTLAPGDDRIELGQIHFGADGIDEHDERFRFGLDFDGLAPVGVDGTITDRWSEMPPNLVPQAETTIPEGNVAIVPVALDFASVNNNTATATEKKITADLVVNPGNATEGTDFTVNANQLIIPPGAGGGEISVPTRFDDELEPPETFTVMLNNVQEAQYSGTPPYTNQHPKVTITDSGQTPTVSLAGPPTAVNEGRAMKFPLTLDRPSGSPIIVKVSTSSDTATENQDYYPLNRTDVIFNPGETTKTVEVGTRHDGEDEANPETITLEIVDFGTALQGANIRATGKVLDGTISVDPGGPIVEGDSGVRDQVFEVRLSAPEESQVQISYDVSYGTAGPDDVGPMPSGQLTFEPGETVKQIVVPIRGDTVSEGANEDFKIRFYNIYGISIPGINNDRQIFIADDDGAPTIKSVSSETLSENNSAAIVTVELSNATQNGVSLPLSAIDGTAMRSGDNAAPGMRDFFFESENVHFGPGQTSATTRVWLVEDQVFEKDESAKIVVSPPANSTQLSGGPVEGTLTITNDDPVPQVNFNWFQHQEGATGMRAGFYLNGEFQDPIPWTATVKGGTDGTGDPAEETDFTRDQLSLSGTLDTPYARTIDLGPMDLVKDHVDEFDEQIEFAVDSPVLGHHVGYGKIWDDQTEVEPNILAAYDQRVMEGDTAVLPLRLDFGMGGWNTATSTEKPVTVDYTTRPSSAMDAADFTPVSGTLTFTPGTDHAQIAIPTVSDDVSEGDERFDVQLSNPRNAQLGDYTIAMTISETAPSDPIVNIKMPMTVAEGGVLKFPVTLDRPGATPITVRLSTVPGTATEADYTPLNNFEVVFEPGQTYKIVEVRTTPDGETESERESVFLEVVDAVGAVPGPAARIPGEILDNIISVVPVDDIIEGATGIRDQVFEVRLNQWSSTRFSVDYQVEPGTAMPGMDFDRPQPGQLWFEPGETVKQIVVPIRGDEADEGPAETFVIRLSNLTGITAAAGLGDHEFNIIEDDGTPTIVSVSPVAQSEGDGSTTATFTVKLSNAPANAVDLPITATDGTAVRAAGGLGSMDYTVPNTVHFDAGQTTATFDVQINGDTVFEDQETATISVAPPAGSTVVTGPAQQALLTIWNDDSSPWAVFDGFEQGEGAGGVGVWFTVHGQAQAPVPWTLKVDGASDGNSDPAEATDFASQNLRLSGVLQPGATRIDAGTLNLVLDNADEHDETLRAAINLQGIGTTEGFAKIWDWPTQMPPKVVATDQVQVSEAGTATVPVNLDFAAAPGNTALSSEKVITVDYSTTPGTAQANVDYTPVSGTLTFKPGVNTVNVTIPTLADGQIEPGETLTVNLHNATNADVGGVPATVVIREAGDTVPDFKVTSGAAVTEGQNGTAQVTVTMSQAATDDVDFTVTPSDVTARQGATGPGGNDFAAPPSTLRIPQGQTSATISVPINDDQVFEKQETANIRVALAPNETDAAGVAQQGVITINDDDPVPTITVGTVRAAEGGTADVVVTPTGVAEDPIGYLLNLHGTSTEGSLDPAEPGDYVDDQKPAYLPGGATGPVTIKSIPLAADAIDEATETIKVILQNLEDPNQPLQSTLVEITDDPQDRPPSVFMLSTGAVESSGGVDVPVYLAFTGDNGATRTERPVKVGWTAYPETAQATDFGPPAGMNPLVFQPGTTNGSIYVPITNDTDFEQPESFAVQATWAEPAEAQLSGIAIVNIADDDPQPTFRASGDVRASEDGGTATINVELSRPASGDVEFTVGARDDTANESFPGVGGDDYDNPAPVLNIPRGSTSGTVTVPIRNDDVFERDETAYVAVNLAPGETDATGAAQQTTVTITDNEAEPTVTLNPVTVAEGGTATVTGVVKGATQRSVPLQEPVVAGDGGAGDAADPNDFELDFKSELPGGTANGSTVTLGTVRIPADSVDETTEGFTLTIAGSSVDVRIDDDPADAPPTVTIGDETVGEGDDSVTLTVTLGYAGATTATERAITVPWKTVDGTAKGGKDYTARNGTLTFEPGEREATVEVPVIDDTQLEQDQNFTVRLGAATPADVKVAKADGRVTLDDDDKAKAPTLSLPASATGSGRVTITGTAGAGSKVELLGAPGTTGGTFKVLATTDADSEGNFTFKPNLTQGYRLQIRADKITSPVRTVQIKQDPQLVVTSPAKRTARVTVTGDPDREGLNVTVQRQDGRGWDTVDTGKLDEDGIFVVTEKNLTAGKNYVYRATIAASAALGITAGTTPARTIRVK